MTAVATPQTPAGTVLSDNAFILRNLEVYNWGPFGDYLHRAEIDPRGTAIIGPTGSGKTTLIDALLTLITAQPKYNLASTGGHESDRDLMSYVRGVAGAGNDSGDNLHIARPGKTVTAIAAHFANGSQQAQMTGIFWIDGTSSAPSDLKRLWIFSERDDKQLEDWLTLHHDGGSRALKQRARELPGVQVFDSKKAYLAQLRRFYEVGENAFTLLNRAAGLKQLNSIDEIFRELVLDDHSAFGRAAEVAAEFDDLAAIHAELKTARKQQQSLEPIKHAYSAYQTCEQQRDEQQILLNALPIWYASAGHTLWGQRLRQIDGEINALTDRIDSLEHQTHDLQGKADTLKDIYLQAGGASIEQLKEQIATQKQLTDERQRNAQVYRTLAKNLGLDDTLSHEALRANQAQGHKQQAELQAQSDILQRAQLNLGADLVNSQ
ncbi:MAG TPA: ATP-binding protein, partial [Marinagarivorans sp.]